jgi:uncharacterized metal-binding protein YceD (DUF177 family)
VLREDLLDLNDILQHPGRVLAVDVTTEFPEEEDLDLVKPLEGFLEAVSTGNVLLVTGEFKARAVFECARCGGPIELDVEFQIDEQFPVIGTPSSLSHQDFAKVDPTDEPYPLFEGNNLMVEALLRQTFLVNFPSQALCDYGWDGDCPIAKQRGESMVRSVTSRSEFEKLRGLVNNPGEGETA